MGIRASIAHFARLGSLASERVDHLEGDPKVSTAEPGPAYPDAVLFDLDGTLVDTIPDLADAIDAMRAEFDLPSIGPSVVARYVGRGVESLVTRAFAHGGGPPTAASAERALDIFRQHYRACNGARSRIYPGVIAGLQRWGTAAGRLAVVTNKTAEFTLPLLTRMDLARFFDVVVAGDTCARRKPDPAPLLHACRRLQVEPAAALMIGDSIHDALAAQAAGIRMVAVPYGYHGEVRGEALPVEAVVPSIDASVDWAAAHWRR